MNIQKFFNASKWGRKSELMILSLKMVGQTVTLKESLKVLVLRLILFM